MIFRVLLAVLILLCGHPSLAQEQQVQPAVEQPQPDVEVSSAIAAVLAKHGTVERAFLLRAPDSDQIVLALIFAKKYDASAVSEAMSTFASMAPGFPPLTIYLPARTTWKRELGGMEPIYVHP
jgi:hypothetical protein